MKPFSAFLAISALVLALVSVNAAAVDVDRLYEAEVPVPDQGTQARADAVREAFARVLVKVTGQTDVASRDAAQPLLDDAEHFVQQFRYRQAPPPGEEQGAGSAPAAPAGQPDAAPAEPGQLLWARFDPGALNRALAKQGLPVWGRARPATLLWLAVDQGGRRELIGANSGTPMEEVLTAEADRRGLPLRLPLLDLTDRAHLTASDVWGDFEENILDASTRYQTEAVLVGRAYTSGGGWQARWTLYQGGRRAEWDSRGEDRAAVLQQGVDGAAHRLAQRFAQVGSGDLRAQRVLVQVKQVSTLGEYTRSMKYLESLSPVTSLQPFAVAPGSATFRVETRGGREAITQAVRLGHTLTPVQVAPPDPLSAPVAPADGAASGPAQGAAEAGTAADPSATPDLVFALNP